MRRLARFSMRRTGRRCTVPDAGAPHRRLCGKFERLHGPGYALLGNAGEFLDPVFSSGVTIALRSAHLAVHTLVKQLNGATIDWATA
jgi:flavin-dependent dehydrogenase